MDRLRGIASAAAIVVVLAAVFVTTQIADSEGRTLADRIPVVGPVVDAIGLESGGVPGGGPLIQAYDEDERIVETATCGRLRDADAAGRRRIADAIFEVGGREDERFRAIDPGAVVTGIVLACEGRPDGYIVVDAIAVAAG